MKKLLLTLLLIVPFTLSLSSTSSNKTQDYTWIIPDQEFREEVFPEFELLDQNLWLFPDTKDPRSYQGLPMSPITWWYHKAQPIALECNWPDWKARHLKQFVDRRNKSHWIFYLGDFSDANKPKLVSMKVVNTGQNLRGEKGLPYPDGPNLHGQFMRYDIVDATCELSGLNSLIFKVGNTVIVSNGNYINITEGSEEHNLLQEKFIGFLDLYHADAR